MSDKDFTSEEKDARFDAALRKLLNLSGPHVALKDDGAVDVDFSKIVKRGKGKA